MTSRLRSSVWMAIVSFAVACAPPRPSTDVAAPQGTATRSTSEDGSSKTLAQMFEGKFPGVKVEAVGPGVRLIVRNAQNIDGSPGYPLYVIDGNPVAAPDGVFNMNPADIARIEILKDDASTLIWGQRATNGVVKITTKRK